MKQSLLLGALLCASGGWAMAPLPLDAKPPQMIVADQHLDQPLDQPVETDVTVLDHGAAERHQLRLSPTVGDQQQSTLRTAMEFAITFNGQTIPAISAPVMSMVMDWSIDQVEPDGTIHTTFKYVDVKIEANDTTPASISQAIQAQLEPLKGTEGKVVFDDRWTVKDFQYDWPTSGTDQQQQQFIDQLSSSLQQLSSPLPEDAVGIGATWRVPQTVSVSGINIKQWVTYTLLSYQAGVIKLGVNIQQSGDTDAGGIEGLPPDAQVTLAEFTSTGTGQLIHNLGQVTPAQVNLELDAKIVMNVTSGNNSARVNADMNINMSQTATP